MTTTSQPLILAIDIGSSSVRCSAYAADSLVAVTGNSKQLRSVEPSTGTIVLYQEDGTSLLDIVDQCIDETLKELREMEKKHTVIAVGFSTFVMNLVGVDNGGEPVGQVATLSYACNTEEVSMEVHKLKKDLGDDAARELYQKTGAPLHAAYALAQLRVLCRSHPELAKDVKNWQTLASLCLGRWTGRKNISMSLSEASWTGLLNFRRCEYEPGILDLLPKSCCQALPDLADFDELDIHGVPESSSYYERWSELRDARFFLGVGDGACANVGSKCSTTNRIACTVGTSAAARVCMPLTAGTDSVMTVPTGLFCYRIDRSHVLIGGALTDGGSVVEWAKQLLNLQSDQAFHDCMKKVEELAKIDCQSSDRHESPLMVPFLSGERSTGFRSGATGAILGLTRETTAAHFVKSCLEGVTLRIQAIVYLIRQAMDEIIETPLIVASGKALEANGPWRQMLCDCTGMDVVLDQETQEGTSRGVACLVSMAMAKREAGAASSVEFLKEESLHSSIVSTPRQESRDYWKRSSMAQENLIEAVSPLFMQLQ